MSLNQEIKDFLSAYQTGQKITGFKDDQEYKRARTKLIQAQLDPEMIALNKQRIKAGLGVNSAHQAVLAAQARDLNDPEMRAAKLRQTNSHSDFYERYNQNPAGDLGGYGSTGAVPYVAPGSDAVPTPAPAPNVQGALDDENPLTQNASRGGLIKQPKKVTIKKYAEGGAVDEDSSDESSQDEDDSEGETGGSTQIADNSSPSVASDAPPTYSRAAAHDAALDGSLEAARMAGLRRPPGAVGGTNPGSARAYLSGAGAAPQGLIEAAKKVVDPQGKLPESERNLAAMGNAYQFYINKGDKQKADAVAAQFVQFYRRASMQYANFAVAAMNKGDMDGAAKLAMKAYANVPDGRNTEIVPDGKGGFAFQSTDETGKVTQKGIATPQQLGAAAMGLGAGKNFDQYLMQAAGQRGAVGGDKPVKAPAAMKPADRTNTEKAIEGHYSEAVGADDEKTDKKLIPDKDTSNDLQNTAFHILNDPNNSGLSSREAVAAALHLSGVKPLKNDPRGTGDDIKSNEDGSKVVKMRNGATVHLSQDTWQRLTALRAQRIKAEGPEQEAPGGEGLWEKTKAVGSKIGDAVSKLGSGMADNMKKNYAAELERRKAATPVQQATKSGAIPDDNFE